MMHKESLIEIGIFGGKNENFWVECDCVRRVYI